MTAKTLPFAFLPSALLQAPRWLRRLLAWRPQPHHQQLAAAELRAMSDLELRDLGIGRSEVDQQLRLGRDPEF